jgi:ribosome-associated protein
LSQEEIDRLTCNFPRYWSIKNQEIVIASQQHRDAIKNKADCIDKFLQIIKDTVKTPKKRIPTKPTKSSIERRINSKIKNSLKKQNRKPI